MSAATLPPAVRGVGAQEALAMDLFGQHRFASDADPLPDPVLIAQRWGQLSAQARERWMRVAAFASAIVAASHAPPTPLPSLH